MNTVYWVLVAFGIVVLEARLRARNVRYLPRPPLPRRLPLRHPRLPLPPALSLSRHPCRGLS